MSTIGHWVRGYKRKYNKTNKPEIITYISQFDLFIKRRKGKTGLEKEGSEVYTVLQLTEYIKLFLTDGELSNWFTPKHILF